MSAVPRNILQAALFICALLGPATASAARADVTDKLNACFNFLKAQDYARAQQTAQALLKRTDLGRTYQLSVNLCLGRAYSNTGRIKDALPAFQQVEALSQSTEELAVAYNWLGGTYENLGDLDRAELYSQRALKAFRELGNEAGEADALNNLALLVKKRGDLERALALFREALAMQPESGQATTLNNIALIHGERKEYPQAIELLRKAIAINQRNGNAHGTAHALINLGTFLREDDQFPAAEKELLAGLSAIRLVGDKYWEAETCMELATLELSQWSRDKARPWLSKAEALYRELGNTKKADAIANLLARK